MFASIEQLYSYFLRNFEIYCNNTVVNSGKLRLISMKDYLINFSYADSKDRIKFLDFPYPYKITYMGNNVFEFDYTLDTLCNCKDKFNQLKAILLCLNQDKKQKFFDKKVYIKFLN